MQVLATWRNTEMKDMATSVLLCQGFVTSKDVDVEVINGGKTLRYLVKWPASLLDAGNIMKKRFNKIHSKVPPTDTESKDFNKEQAAIDETITTLKAIFPDGIIRSEEIVSLPFQCEEGKPKTSWVPLIKVDNRCIVGLMLVFMKRYLPPVKETKHEEVDIDG